MLGKREREETLEEWRNEMKRNGVCVRVDLLQANTTCYGRSDAQSTGIGKRPDGGRRKEECQEKEEGRSGSGGQMCVVRPRREYETQMRRRRRRKTNEERRKKDGELEGCLQ